MLDVRSFDGVRIAYRSFGDGPKVVMLVHGWSMSGAVWNELIVRLSLAGIRLLVPDLRGAGASERPSTGYRTETYARDLLTVADSAGAERFVVVGHSRGGQLGQWLAVTAPERVSGLVVMNGVPASGLSLPEDAAQLFRSSGGDRRKIATILDLACKSLTANAREALLSDAERVSPVAVREDFESWSSARFAERLCEIRVPTLVVATDESFLPAPLLREATVSRISGARLAVVPGAGHYPQVERPAETTALLEAFLAGHA